MRERLTVPPIGNRAVGIPSSIGRGRNAYIDLLRAAAICPVLLVHWVQSAVTQRGASFGADLYLYAAIKGANGVLLFFVISGFVITRSVMAREPDFLRLSFRSFYCRRFARIYPLLLATCILGIALLAFSDPRAPLNAYIVRNPAAVLDAGFWISIFTYTFNIWRIVYPPASGVWGLQWDVLWSLAVEEQFYVLFPLVLFLCRTRKRLFVVLSSVIFLSFGYRLLHRWTYSPMDSRICFELIAAGVMAAAFGPTIPRSLRVPVAVFGGAVLCTGFFAPNGSIAGLFMQEFISIGAGILLCCAASTLATVPRLFRPIAFIGELSFGMYLLHPVVLYAVGTTIGPLGDFVGYFVFLAATVMIATLSYRYYEQPSERFVRGMLISRNHVAAQVTQS